MIRYSILAVSFVCFATVPRTVAAGEDPLNQNFDGGWQRGDKRVECATHSETYVFEIQNGVAQISIDGNEQEPSRVTYIPEGFVLTHSHKGVGKSYYANIINNEFYKRSFGSKFFKVEESVRLSCKN